MSRSISLVKRNVSKMVDQNAPEKEIDAYIASEGYTIDHVKDYKPVETNLAERALIGTGRGLVDVWEGAKQLGLEAGEKIGLADPGSADEYTRQAQAERDYYQQTGVGASGAGKVGRFVGNVAPYAAIPLAGTGAGLAARGAALGAGMGGTSFVPEGSSRAMQAGTSGLIGGVAPFAIPALGAGARKLPRAMLRGFKSPQKAAQNVATARAAGMVDEAGRPIMSVGLATEGQLSTMLEGVSGTTLGGSGTVVKLGNKIQEVFAKRMNDVIKKISKGQGFGADDVSLGMHRSLFDKTNTQAFVTRMGNVAEKMYNKVDIHLGNKLKGIRLLPTSTKQALTGPDSILIKTDRAALNKAFDKPLFRKYLYGLGDDQLPPTPMTWKDMKLMQREVGQKLSKVDLTPDIQRVDLNRLYAAISDDMGRAIANTGNAKAVKAYTNANKFFQWKSKTTDQFLAKLERTYNSPTPDKLRDVIFASAKAGPSSIRNIRKATDKETWRQAVASWVHSLGRQGGDDISSGSFYNAYKKIPPSVKREIFAKDQQLIKYGKDLDHLFNYAKGVAKGPDVLRAEGSAGIKGAITYLLMATTTATSGVAFGPGGAGLTLGGMIGGSWAAGKILANPRTVNWLVKATKMNSPKLLEKHAGKLLALRTAQNAEEIDWLLEQIGVRNDEAR